MNDKIFELQELFKNREFSKLIFIIENSINDEDKSPGILNILGVARIIKKKNQLYSKKIVFLIS